MKEARTNARHFGTLAGDNLVDSKSGADKTFQVMNVPLSNPRAKLHPQGGSPAFGLVPIPSPCPAG